MQFRVEICRILWPENLKISQERMREANISKQSQKGRKRKVFKEVCHLEADMKTIFGEQGAYWGYEGWCCLCKTTGEGSRFEQERPSDHNAVYDPCEKKPKGAGSGRGTQTKFLPAQPELQTEDCWWELSSKNCQALELAGNMGSVTGWGLPRKWPWDFPGWDNVQWEEIYEEHTTAVNLHWLNCSIFLPNVCSGCFQDPSCVDSPSVLLISHKWVSRQATFCLLLEAAPNPLTR